MDDSHTWSQHPQSNSRWSGVWAAVELLEETSQLQKDGDPASIGVRSIRQPLRDIEEEIKQLKSIFDTFSNGLNAQIS